LSIWWLLVGAEVANEAVVVAVLAASELALG
jgi:hypothetical protein